MSADSSVSGTLVQTPDRIRDLERNVALSDIVLAGLVLIVGLAGWRKFLWGVPLGMVLGFASFHLLIAQMSRIGSTGGWAIASVVVLSTFKLAGLFLIVLGLHAVQAVDLVQVLVGLLLSQFGIGGGIAWEMRRMPLMGATPKA